MEKNKYDFIRKIDVEKFGDVLRMKLNIPIYQRDYAWEEDEIEAFLDDIDDLRENKETNHFLGQIVVHYDENKGKYNIIDGQQRISTAVILINNIQRIAKRYHEELLIEKKNKKLTERFYNLSVEARPYVETKNEYNLNSKNMFFKTILDKEDKENDYKHNKVNKRIKKCDEIIERKLNEKLDTINKIDLLSGERLSNSDTLEEKCKLLESILEIITEKLIVIYLETPELEKAFIIFESLNAMGKTLETAELLKNYILMKSEDKEKPQQLNNANNSWNRISENINQIDMTTFIRHYWNSRRDFIRKEELYGQLVKEINNYEDVCNFLISLEKNSETYAALYTPYENDCFKGNEIKEAIEDINSLGAKTYYPIILAMKDRQYEEKYILDVLHLLENYIFRNYTICGKNPNKAEPKFAEIAMTVYKDGISVEEISKKIMDDSVTTEEFEMAFKSKELKKVDAVKYMLRKIHNYIYKNEKHREGEKALSTIKKSTEDIHLEHILPQKYEKWTKAGILTEEQAKNYLWRIGNLMLLGKEFNEMIQNDLYERKLEKGYSKSCIHPNEYFTKENEKPCKWDVEEIEKRQNKLYDYAKKIWTKDGLNF